MFSGFELWVLWVLALTDFGLLLCYTLASPDIWVLRLCKHSCPRISIASSATFFCRPLINVSGGGDCQDEICIFALWDFPDNLSCHPCCHLEFTWFLLVKSLHLRQAHPLHICAIIRYLPLGVEGSALLCPPMKFYPSLVLIYYGTLNQLLFDSFIEKYVSYFIRFFFLVNNGVRFFLVLPHLNQSETPQLFISLLYLIHSFWSFHQTTHL